LEIDSDDDEDGFWTLEKLSSDCRSKGRMLVSVKRKIYNVAASEDMYRNSKFYESLLGHDVSFAMAKHSFEANLFDKRYDYLTTEEASNLENYVQIFASKYPVIGELFEDELFSGETEEIAQCESFNDLSLLKKMSFEEFEQLGKPFIAVKGVVFNVSNVPADILEVIRPSFGHEATLAFARNHHDSDLFERSNEKLSYDETCTLETWFRFLHANAEIVGTLQGSSWLQNQNLSGDQIHSSKMNKLHGFIVEGDAVAIRGMLLGEDIAVLVNSKCERTSLTAVHKAVESGNLEVVKSLVESNGADLSIGADLYDGETALEMAKRFRYEDIVEYLLLKSST
jgi:predicted heme/steroid binding protein